MNVNEERPMVLDHYADCFLQDSDESGCPRAERRLESREKSIGGEV